MRFTRHLAHRAYLVLVVAVGLTGVIYADIWQRLPHRLGADDFRRDVGDTQTLAKRSVLVLELASHDALTRGFFRHAFDDAGELTRKRMVQYEHERPDSALASRLRAYRAVLVDVEHAAGDAASPEFDFARSMSEAARWRTLEERLRTIQGAP
jgi:hypothetical protein